MVVTAKDGFGESTDDEELLRYCGENNFLLVTHGKKDFTGTLPETVEHGGIVTYTGSNYLRDDPEGAVHTLERILSHYPLDDLRNERVWLDQSRR